MREGGLILAAGRVRSKKPNEPPPPHEIWPHPKPTTEKHSSPATAKTSRWCATKQVPSVSLSSPASVDTDFVGIDHVQLSQ